MRLSVTGGTQWRPGLKLPQERRGRFLAAFEYGSPEGIYDLPPHCSDPVILTLSIDLGSHWAKLTHSIDAEDRQFKYVHYIHILHYIHPRAGVNQPIHSFLVGTLSPSNGLVRSPLYLSGSLHYLWYKGSFTIILWVW